MRINNPFNIKWRIKGNVRSNDKARGAGEGELVIRANTELKARRVFLERAWSVNLLVTKINSVERIKQ